MSLRLCQLKSLWILLLILAGGCSLFRSDSSDDELVNILSANWFSNPKHAVFDRELKAQPHLFFDVNPSFGQNGMSTNVVVVTPQGSDHAYRLDLASGQRHYSHSYCAQSDVWSKYSGSINKPRFTIGVIPRFLDQIGEPQKVIIFGGAKKYVNLTDKHDHPVRLVGALIEQHCLEGNCLGKSNWISRMVFMAVDPEDKKFGKVTNTEELKKEIDWEEVRAVVENLDGRNGSAGANYPAVRVGQMIPLGEALSYFKKGSIYLSEKESKKIREGCHALYDRLWSEVGMELPEDRAAKTVPELNAKLKLREELKKKRKPVGFAARFKIFTKKYYQEFSTCQKFVYHGNVNLDREAFWFYSFVGLYYKLHRDGYFFDCRRKTWQRNVINTEGNLVHDLKRDIDQCSERDIDMAMEYLPNFLTGLKVSGDEYYKFVDYDTHSFGTHQKLYSWVKVKSKNYECTYDPNPDIKKEIKVFPEDVTWKKRDVDDIEDDLKIIY